MGASAGEEKERRNASSYSIKYAIFLVNIIIKNQDLVRLSVFSFSVGLEFKTQSKIIKNHDLMRLSVI
jgi:hypothetical protein